MDLCCNEWIPRTWLCACLGLGGPVREVRHTKGGGDKSRFVPVQAGVQWSLSPMDRLFAAAVGRRRRKRERKRPGRVSEGADRGCQEEVYAVIKSTMGRKWVRPEAARRHAVPPSMPSMPLTADWLQGRLQGSCSLTPPVNVACHGGVRVVACVYFSSPIKRSAGPWDWDRRENLIAGMPSSASGL